MAESVTNKLTDKLQLLLVEDDLDL
ncbi:DNA-binding response regulator, partial [Vibrio splendidus]